MKTEHPEQLAVDVSRRVLFLLETKDHERAVVLCRSIARAGAPGSAETIRTLLDGPEPDAGETRDRRAAHGRDALAVVYLLALTGAVVWLAGRQAPRLPQLERSGPVPATSGTLPPR